MDYCNVSGIKGLCFYAVAAVLYHRWGKLDLAKRHYELALKLDPGAPGTKENYSMLKRKVEQQQRTVG